MFNPQTGYHTYYVYILTNKHRTTFYIGVTNNLSIRLQQHLDSIQANNVSSFVGRYQLGYLVFVQDLQPPAIGIGGAHAWINQYIQDLVFILPRFNGLTESLKIDGFHQFLLKNGGGRKIKQRDQKAEKCIDSHKGKKTHQKKIDIKVYKCDFTFAVEPKLWEKVNGADQNNHQKQDGLPLFFECQIRNPFQVDRKRGRENGQKYQSKDETVIKIVSIEENKKHTHQQ